MGTRGRYGGYIPEDLKKNSSKLSFKMLVRIFRYLLPYWPKLLLATVSIFITALFDLLPSILTGRIIDDGFLAGDLKTLVLLVLCAFCVVLFSGLVNILKTYLNIWVAQNIIKNMRNEMYAHLQKMSQRFFSTNKQGEILTRMTSDIDGVREVIVGTLSNTLSNIALLIIAIVALYEKNWILASVGLLIIPLFILPTKLVGKKRWQLTLQTQKQKDTLNQILSETLSISGQQLVKLFTNERKEYAAYSKANEEMCRLTVRSQLAGRWYRMIVSTFTNMGPLLIYLLGGILVLHYGVKGLTIGDITVMATLLTRMYNPVHSLLELQVELIQGVALFERIFSYFDLPIEIKNSPKPIFPVTINGDVSFENVCFAYQGDKQVLTNISFRVPAGKMYAIVGPSGAGKSTISSLMVRLYDVTRGMIRLDEHDIREIDLECLRKNVGLVTQDNYLFNGTIRENLLYAKATASEEEMIEACRKANIHDHIESLPDGYDTVVGNRGIKLSGGEKQRISIARIILRDPKVLILDEATASLDSISESLIQTAIEPLLKDRTSIVIAHRLSTIMSADQILVVSDGKIVEQGDHKTLLNADGLYTRLYNTQFRNDGEK